MRRGDRLTQSIYSQFRSSPRDVVMRVGAKARHALTIHQGSKPHTIYSRRGKTLKFRWERGDFLVAARSGRRRGNRRTGQFHYFLRVRHPGNKRPVRYLAVPLALFGRRNGFEVKTSGWGRTRLP